jgi:hypothetical protein
MTITEFITARAADKEQRARRLLRIAQEAELSCGEPQLLGRRIPGWYAWPDVAAMCERSISEVAATRAIVAMWSDPAVSANPRAHGYASGRDDEEVGRALAIDEVVRHLAAIDKAHPDYDPSWAPETADAR